MTTHTFPWQQVAQSCPQAFEAFYNEMYDAFPLPETLDEFYFALVKHATLVSEVGYLEAFFDGQGILVTIPEYDNMVSPDLSVWIYNIKIKGCKRGYAGLRCDTRQEAQIAGFQKAFEILESRLKGGEG